MFLFDGLKDIGVDGAGGLLGALWWGLFLGRVVAGLGEAITKVRRPPAAILAAPAAAFLETQREGFAKFLQYTFGIT